MYKEKKYYPEYAIQGRGALKHIIFTNKLPKL